MDDDRPILEESFDEAAGVGRVIVPSPRALREALGAPILAGLARLCISADRLTSLSTMLDLNSKHFDEESSIGAQRNRIHLFLLSCGVSFELAGDIIDLHDLGFAKRLSPTGFKAWRTLRKMAAKWLHDPFFQKIRHQAAFHTDAGAVTNGINALIDDGDPFIVVEGTSPANRESRYTFSLGALLRGLWPEHLPLRGRKTNSVSTTTKEPPETSAGGDAEPPMLARRFDEISSDQAQVIRLLPDVIMDLCQELKRARPPGDFPSPTPSEK